MNVGSGNNLQEFMRLEHLVLYQAQERVRLMDT